MALGRAWVTVASIAIASSFWSSGATTVGRARAGFRPREFGREDLAKPPEVYLSVPSPKFAANGWAVASDARPTLRAHPPGTPISAPLAAILQQTSETGHLAPSFAGRRRLPAVDPGARDLGRLGAVRQLVDRLLDPLREGARGLALPHLQRLADPHRRLRRQRDVAALGHDPVGAADVHRDDVHPVLGRQVADPRPELLQGAGVGASAFGEDKQVPARLEKLAGAVQHLLGPAGAREGEGVEPEAGQEADHPPAVEVVRRGCNH